MEWAKSNAPPKRTNTKKIGSTITTLATAIQSFLRPAICAGRVFIFSSLNSNHANTPAASKANGNRHKRPYSLAAVSTIAPQSSCAPLISIMLKPELKISKYGMRAKKAMVNTTTAAAPHTLRIGSDGHFISTSCSSVVNAKPISAIMPAVLRLKRKPYHRHRKISCQGQEAR